MKTAYDALLKGKQITIEEYNHIFTTSLMFCNYRNYKVASPYTIEDFITEAIHKAITKIHQYDENKGTIKWWYLTILKNEYLHYYNRERFSDKNMHTDIFVNSEDEDYDVFGYVYIEQEDYDENNNKELLERYIFDNYQELYLFTYKDYSLNDLCKKFNIELHTIKNLLSRQRKSVYQHFNGKPKRKTRICKR